VKLQLNFRHSRVRECSRCGSPHHKMRINSVRGHRPDGHADWLAVRHLSFRALTSATSQAHLVAIDDGRDTDSEYPPRLADPYSARKPPIRSSRAVPSAICLRQPTLRRGNPGSTFAETARFPRKNTCMKESATVRAGARREIAEIGRWLSAKGSSSTSLETSAISRFEPHLRRRNRENQSHVAKRLAPGPMAPIDWRP
jgi:hypothetical protein